MFIFDKGYINNHQRGIIQEAGQNPFHKDPDYSVCVCVCVDTLSFTYKIFGLRIGNLFIHDLFVSMNPYFYLFVVKVKFKMDLKALVQSGGNGAGDGIRTHNTQLGRLML